MQTIEQRLASLEHSQRRWKLVSAALAIGLVGVCVLAAGPAGRNADFDTLTVKALTVTSGNEGGAVVIGGRQEDGATILLRSQTGKATIRMSAADSNDVAPAAYLTVAASPKGGPYAGPENEVGLSADDQGGVIVTQKPDGRHSRVTFTAPPAK